VNNLVRLEIPELRWRDQFGGGDADRMQGAAQVLFPESGEFMQTGKAGGEVVFLS